MPVSFSSAQFLDHENGERAHAQQRFRPWAWGATSNVGANSPLAPPASEVLNHRAALVLVDAHGERVASVDLSFNERITSGRRVTAIGSDSTSALSVVVAAMSPALDVKVTVRFQPAPKALPEDLVPILEFLDAIDAETRLGLWSHHVNRWLTEPVASPGPMPDMPTGYFATVKTLAEVQKQSGIVFPMPDEITEEEARNLERAAVLLSGGVVEGTWTELTMPVDAAIAEVLKDLSEPGGARFEFSTDFSVMVSGRELTVGQVRYRLMQMKVGEVFDAAEQENDRLVTLAPGADNRFVISLASETLEEGAQEPLEAFAGKWIAQQANAVIASGDSPEDVASALRELGVHAAIWRVPASAQEADRTVIGL
jgi:hypothetical protein